MKELIAAKKIIVFILVILSCLNIFSAEGRYFFDDKLVGKSYLDFIATVYYPNYPKNIKCLEIEHLDNGNSVHVFALKHVSTDYDMLNLYLENDTLIVKTVLYNKNEIIGITEEEKWMATIGKPIAENYNADNEKRPNFKEITVDDNKSKSETMSWVMRNFGWTVPSKEFVDDCTPSRETVLNTCKVAITLAGILVLFI